jgi:flagellar biosynthesis protein FlhA
MNKAQLAMPLVIVIILTALLVPLPSAVLDILISANISLSVVVLLSAVYVLNPIEFSAFPSILLLTTLFRLSLNIASTRLILLDGSSGTGAAGNVIGAFGEFVVGGNYAVGLIIFLVLIIIQYVVINHGAVRISEVTARFTLDALPGKQLSIDADLNAGIIEQEEARQRRADVSQEATFYGAMDGAIRFTQRDAIASMLITAINVIGGLFIGMFQNDMGAVDALETFTILTIGDGLVTTIPSLLISIAGGLITTRAAAKSTLSQEVGRQLFSNPRAVFISAAIVGGLGLIPGLPTFAFVTLGGVLVFVGMVSLQYEQDRELEPPVEEEPPEEEGTVERATAFLKIDSLAVEIGYGLIGIVDAEKGGDFLARIRSIRKQLAQELGLIVPPVNITDNLKLSSREYTILLKGVEIGRGELMLDRLLAIDPGSTTGKIEGTETKEPTFGLPAYWITKDNKERAQLMNYTVVDASTILATHLTEMIRANAHELLGRQDVKTLIDHVAETHPKLTEELVPNTLSVGEIQKVLQSLLREKVSIRDLVTIFESLADFGVRTKDAVALTEATRGVLSRSITRPLLNEKGELAVISLSPVWEAKLKESLIKDESGAYLSLDSTSFQELVQAISESCQKLTSAQWTLLCSSGVRHHLRKLIERFIPQLTVVSPNDIPPNLQIVSQGVVGQ